MLIYCAFKNRLIHCSSKALCNFKAILITSLTLNSSFPKKLQRFHIQFSELELLFYLFVTYFSKCVNSHSRPLLRAYCVLSQVFVFAPHNNMNLHNSKLRLRGVGAADRGRQLQSRIARTCTHICPAVVMGTLPTVTVTLN